MPFCPDCKQDKHKDLFFKNRARARGHTTYCKPCMTKRSVVWSKANKDKRNAVFKRCREKKKRELGIDKFRAMIARQKILSVYGISGDEYDLMVSHQGGECSICRRTPKTKLHVDHDHKTGKIRDLLCGPCNTGLGSFRENHDILLSAIDYLRRHGSLVESADELR